MHHTRNNTFHKKCCLKCISKVLERLKLYRKDQVDYGQKLSSAIKLLVNYSLVEEQENNNDLNIHMLVQQVLQLKLRETNQEKSILRDALILVSKLIKHGKLNACHSHTVSVYRSLLKYKDLTKEFNTLVCWNKQPTIETYYL